MKLTTSIAAGTAVLALAGGLFAVQASAEPTTPAPGPAATTKADDSTRIAWFYRALTDVQRQCLADANLQRPEGKLTDAQVKELQQQVQAALKACDVTLPAKVSACPRLGFRFAALTGAQQQCLADARRTRPLGRLTDAQKAEVRQSVVETVKGCVG